MTWFLAHWRALLVGLLAVVLLGWGGCAAYGAAVRWSAARDAELRGAIARADSVLAEHKVEHDSLLALQATSRARADSIRVLANAGAAARAAQAEAQAIAARLRRQLGAPQTARDTAYQAVIAAQDTALAKAREAADADSLRIVQLTRDRDGWKANAERADSLRRVSDMALGNLAKAAKPERCLLGLIVCPRREVVAAVALVVGLGAGYALHH